MNNKSLLISALALALCATSQAQVVQKATVDKPLANYELAEHFNEFGLGGKSTRISLSVTPNAINDTDNFWYHFDTSKSNDYYLVRPALRKQEALFDNAVMAEQLSLKANGAIDARSLSISPTKFAKDLSWFEFEYRDKNYRFNRYTNTLTDIEAKKDDEDREVVYSWMKFSPDRKYILYAKNYNLFVKGNKAKGMDTTEVQLTFDGEKNFSYGNAREEKERTRKDAEVATNARWCPDSRHVFIVRDDDRKCRDNWVINSLSKKPSLVTFKYEYAGDKHLTQYILNIIDVKERTCKKPAVEKWQDQYIQYVHATADGKLLFFERNKRTWDQVDLISVNTSTMEVKTIVHEEDKPYRDPHAKSVCILNNGKDILFRSERTGWGHYYHYDGNGRLLNTITSGNWVAGNICAVDTLARTVYLYGYGKEKNINPHYYTVYKAHIDREGVAPVAVEDGQHNADFLKSRKYFIDTYSKVNQEPVITLKDNTGKTLLKLAKPDLSNVKAKGWVAPEPFSVMAADDRTELFGVMYKPANFDPKKKYPIVSVVYPGPYYGFVPTAFALSENHCSAMAQLGMIVIKVGHRGDTPMRGKVYHVYGYNNMRDYPLADDKYAIEQLAKRYDFIDINRVGIFGHSGGGFMAAAAILTYPDFYKAAVSCSGNHDNTIYNRGWVECYNGVREVEKTVTDSLGNKKTEYEYKYSVKTNQELANNLKGNLLLVTGDMDVNVTPANTYRLANALMKAGKDFDMLVIPGAGHGYGTWEEYFEQKMYRYFAKHLIGDYRSDNWADNIYRTK